MASETPLAGYPAVQDYLFGLKAGGLKFGIDRMRLLAEKLGNPERLAPCFHVGGTNGKGSVAAMLDSVLRASGRRTGLYTSPHLVRLGERVQVDRHILTEEEICAYVAELGPLAEAIVTEGSADDRPSFFEFMTAMAFLQFARKQCGFNVIEVGLGGRLDATNIVLPEVSIVTSIGLDHCEMLGDTLAAIAGEKAGIVKPGRPLVMGRVPPEAEAVLRRVAHQNGSPVVSVREAFGDDIRRYPSTNLEGDYQRWNAATARLACEALPPRHRISAADIERGLLGVDWPGRWQRTRIGGRLAILDASHNPEGAQVLDANLERLHAQTGRKPVGICGATGAARARPLLEVLSRHCSELHLAVPHQARATSHQELESLLPRGFAGKVVRATVEGLFPAPGTCTAGGPDDVIVVTGSIYLLGEILGRLEPQRGPGEGRLQDF